MDLPWDNLLGLRTDCAPAMCGQESVLFGMIQEKMREEDAGRRCGKKMREEDAGRRCRSTYSLSLYHTSGSALLQSPAKCTCCELYKESSQLHKSQRFKSPVVQVLSEGVAFGIQRLPYHTKVRWLNRGKVPSRCFEICEEICQVMERKMKDTAEMRDRKLLCKLAFLSDIVSHLDVLNMHLYGRGHIITDTYATVRAFKTKLCL